jgi:signal peptidase I
VPGDIVEMRDDVLYLNGLAANYRPFDAALAGPAWQDPGENTLFTERIATSGIPHAIMENHRLPGCRTVKPIHIPPGKFFVMGDNRDDSFDSRYFGLVDRSQILGRSGYILISLNQYCLLRLRRMLQAFP